MSSSSASLAERATGCPTCGDAGSASFLRTPDLEGVVPGRVFAAERCLACGLVYLEPMPSAEEIGSFYPEAYWWAMDLGRPRDRLLLALRGLLWLDVLALVRGAAPKGGRVLDVGCGSGVFLWLARRAGYRAEGVEQSEAAARVVERQFGVSVGTSLPEEEGAFDAVTLFHVLEHLPDPVGTLRRLRRLLKPEGRLVLEVPNVGSLGYRLMGARWRGLDVPRHLVQFSPASLERMLAAAGFAVERRRTFSLRNAPAILSASLAAPTAQAETKAALGRGSARALAGVALQAAAWLVCLPAALVAALAGRGEVLLVVARRDDAPPAPPSLAAKLLLVLGSTAAGSALLSLVLLVLARLLGPAEIGRYFVVIAVSTFLVLPTGYGLGPATTHLLARDGSGRALGASALGFFGLLFPLSALALAASGPLAGRLGLEPALLRAGVLTSVPLAAYLYAEYALKGLLRFKALAAVRLAVPTFFLAAGLALWAGGWSGWAVPAWARAAACLAAALGALAVLPRPERGGSAALPGYFRFGLRAAAGSAASVFFISADKLAVARLLPPEAVGVYSMHFLASYMVAARLADVFSTVLFPEATRRRAADAEAPYEPLGGRLRLAAAPLAVALFLGQGLAFLLAGKAYPASVPAMLLFAAGGTLYGLAEVGWWHLASLGERGVKPFALHSSLAAALLLAGLWTAVPAWGLMGAGAALALASAYTFTANQLCAARA